MNSIFNLVPLTELASRLTRHPLMQDMDMDTVIQYTVDFIRLIGHPNLYHSDVLEIGYTDYMCLLPEDCMEIITIVDKERNVPYVPSTSLSNSPASAETTYVYKNQGRRLVLSKKEGTIKIAYRRIYTDESSGDLMLPDVTPFIQGLEAYIKLKYFEVLYEIGKLRGDILQNAQQQYAFKVGQATNAFMIPDVQEMENITRMWNSMLTDNKAYHKHFDQLSRNMDLKLQ